MARKSDPLLKEANNLYGRLPAYLQQSIDEQKGSGLEPEEIPDGYSRLGFGEDADENEDI